MGKSVAGELVYKLVHIYDYNPKIASRQDDQESFSRIHDPVHGTPSHQNVLVNLSEVLSISSKIGSRNTNVYIFF